MPQVSETRVRGAGAQKCQAHVVNASMVSRCLIHMTRCKALSRARGANAHHGSCRGGLLFTPEAVNRSRLVMTHGQEVIAAAPAAIAWMCQPSCLASAQVHSLMEFVICDACAVANCGADGLVGLVHIAARCRHAGVLDARACCLLVRGQALAWSTLTMDGGVALTGGVAGWWLWHRWRTVGQVS